MALGIFSARSGRRRRVLKEDVAAENGATTGPTSADDQTLEEGPRYTEGASPENHTQVTDYIPRRYRTIFGGFLAGALLVAGLVTLGNHVGEIAAAAGLKTLDAFTLSSAASLSAWFSSAMLLAGAAYSLLIYSLRRHRIDDYRGRYRMWLWVAGCCVMLSLNTVAPLHNTLSQALAYGTGWTGPTSGALWWLVPSVLLAAWLGLRTLLDMAECRIAQLLLASTLLCGATAVLLSLGGLVVASEMILPSVALGSQLLLLTSLVLYARHVVLDAQGLIEHKASRQKLPKSEKPKRERKRKPKAALVESQSALDLDTDIEPTGTKRTSTTRIDPPHAQPSRRNNRKSRSNNLEEAGDSYASKPSKTRWVDGSESEDDLYDGEENRSQRKLTKAERKRLRKEKALARR